MLNVTLVNVEWPALKMNPSEGKLETSERGERIWKSELDRQETLAAWSESEHAAHFKSMAADRCTARSADVRS